MYHDIIYPFIHLSIHPSIHLTGYSIDGIVIVIRLLLPPGLVVIPSNVTTPPSDIGVDEELDRGGRPGFLPLFDFTGTGLLSERGSVKDGSPDFEEVSRGT